LLSVLPSNLNAKEGNRSHLRGYGKEKRLDEERKFDEKPWGKMQVKFPWSPTRGLSSKKEYSMTVNASPRGQVGQLHELDGFGERGAEDIYKGRRSVSNAQGNHKQGFSNLTFDIHRLEGLLLGSLEDRQGCCWIEK
jgi:hypothetical protein